MSVARADSLRSVAFGSITNSYTNLGTPLTHNWRMWRITNNTNGDMFFSFDGTNDNLFVPANSFVLYDISANDDTTNNPLFMSLGTQFLIKYSSAPTSGSVYLEGFYAQGQ